MEQLGESQHLHRNIFRALVYSLWLSNTFFDKMSPDLHTTQHTFQFSISSLTLLDFMGNAQHDRTFHQ